MCGNVNEWCWDIYVATVSTDLSITGPAYTSGSSIKRAKRGGGWDSDDDDDATLFRHDSNTEPYKNGGDKNREFYFGYGFRVVRTATVQ
jgi:formylglycine-generating enzyme required for sulfatase activity